MKNSSNEIEITIQTGRGAKQFTVAKQMKVSQLIQEAVLAFGFAPGDRFELMLASNTTEALAPERPLVSYGIAAGAILILTATGSGV